MKAIVTGGLGFIGSHVTDELVKQGHETIVIDNESTGTIKNLHPSARYEQADITNYESIAPLFEGADCVFHLAALPRILPSFQDPKTFLRVNVEGTINCFKAAMDAKVNRFILSSSSSVYGNEFTLPTPETNPVCPLNPYAFQKFEAESYCRILRQDSDLEVVALRYFNVYGPRSFNEKDKFSAYSSPVCIFIKKKAEGLPMPITWDGEQKRDYVFVEDVARANVRAARAPLEKKFDIFNVGSGENHTVNEIAEIIGGEKIYIPKRPGEARLTLADITKARTMLAWEPTMKFEEGIKYIMKSEGVQ